MIWNTSNRLLTAKSIILNCSPLSFINWTSLIYSVGIFLTYTNLYVISPLMDQYICSEQWNWVALNLFKVLWQHRSDSYDASEAARGLTNLHWWCPHGLATQTSLCQCPLKLKRLISLTDQLASLGESLSDARLVKPCFEHQVELFSLLANRNLSLAIQIFSMSLPHASLHLVFRAWYIEHFLSWSSGFLSSYSFREHS